MAYLNSHFRKVDFYWDPAHPLMAVKSKGPVLKQKHQPECLNTFFVHSEI